MNNNQNGTAMLEAEQQLNGEETLIPRTKTTTFTLQAGDTVTVSISRPLGVQNNDAAAGAADSLAAPMAAPPVITSFSPMIGMPGNPIVISGLRLSLVNGVFFNGVPAGFTRNADNTLTAYVPDGATDGPIAVTSPFGTSTSEKSFDVFPVIVPPQFTVDGFSPKQGPQGTPVIITGVGFTGVQRVAFGNPNGNGDTPAQFEILSDRKIRAIVPPVTDASQLGFKTIKVKKGQLLVNATTLFNVTFL